MKIIVLKGLPASGKGQPADHIIPTPDGDKRMDELKVGDYVFGSDGKPTRIFGVFPRGELQTYKVEMRDGSWLEVDGDHLWTIERPRRFSWQTRSTKNLMATKSLSNFRIPLCQPLQYKEKKHIIDPYLMGLYLADGYSSSNNNIVTITKNSPEVIAKMKKCSIKPYRSETYQATRHLYDKKSGFCEELERMGLRDKRSREKFIPQEYLFDSAENREELLRGLMDGDGSVAKKGCSQNTTAVYGTTSEKLADGVFRLVTSLGGCAKKRFVNSDKYWKVSILLPFNPFGVSKEKGLYRNNRVYYNRFIRKITPLRKTQIICIAVEAPDQLYVADTKYHIVTHNTSWAQEQARKGNYFVVSKDEIRKMFGGYKPKREKDVLRVRNRLIGLGIELKRNVIVDDTNLNPKHERYIKQLAAKLGAKFEINDSFLEETPEVCIERDIHRGEKAVGASVIWRMYYQWIAPHPLKKLSKGFDKPRAVLCDLDGTLCLNTENRSFYDMSRVAEDTCNPFIGCIVDALFTYGMEANGVRYPEIIFMSGRSENARKDTEEWLKRNGFGYKMLLMRADGDSRPDAEVKEELYHRYVEPEYSVLGVIDDRNSVARRWRSLGLMTLQTGFPEIEF